MGSSTAIWVSAAASAVASVVALFGPVIRAWWARPRVTLHEPVDLLPTDELIFAGPDKGDTNREMQFVVLNVTNHGRTQLDDVEAVLTAYQQIGPIEATNDADSEIPAFDIPVVSRGLLQFELADAANPRVAIPPYATRTLRLAVLGTDDAIRRELERRGEQVPTKQVEVSGAFALWPLEGADRTTWLLDDDATTIEIALSARNAKAATWKATVRAWYWSGMRDEQVDLSGVKFDWDAPLRRVRGATPPTPRRAWIARHTPWAIWRERQFRRELARARTEDGTNTHE